MQENKKDRHEELPIEEFENDSQDFRQEFLSKFSNKKENIDKVEKSNFDHFKDFSIQQLSYLVESDDIEKSEAAKEILREKLK